jgi:hypothetical protein
MGAKGAVNVLYRGDVSTICHCISIFIIQRNKETDISPRDKLS